MRTLVVLPTYNEILNVEPMLRTLRKRRARRATSWSSTTAAPTARRTLAEEVGEELGQITVLAPSEQERTRRRVPRGLRLGDRARLRPLRRDRLRLLATTRARCPTLLERRGGPRRGDRLALRHRRAHPAVVAARAGCSRAAATSTRRSCSACAWRTRRPAIACIRRRRSTRSATETVQRRRLRLPDRDDLPRAPRAARRSSRCRSPSPTATLGESKMSGAIVVEALWLVTKWALERPFGAGRH